MATPLKRLAKQSLAGAKKRVRLHPLSPEEATSVVFTVLNASPAPLLRAAKNSKAGKGLPKNVQETVFANAIRNALNVRKGSVYAAIVTAIDQDDVFHTDRFAVSLKRLGVMDDIAMKLTADGFGAIAPLVQNKAPFWWAEMSARELSTVQKEMSGSFKRILHKFTEDLDEATINQIVEADAFGLGMSGMPGRLQFMHGVSQTNLGASQSRYMTLARNVIRPNSIKLAENSSFDGVFSSFHEHLMTNVSALQRLLPRATFGGKMLTPTQLQRIFRDVQFTKRLKQAFEFAYRPRMHVIELDGLYRALKRYNVQKELERAAKMYAKIDLSTEAVASITSSIIGLFSAFTTDAKGQSFPMMASIKKG
jgi:hypothetical protein